jgi:hypothetical protein
MTARLPQLSGYYVLRGKLYIIADHPNAQKLIDKCPDLPVVKLKDLDAQE